MQPVRFQKATTVILNGRDPSSKLIMVHARQRELREQGDKVEGFLVEPPALGQVFGMKDRFIHLEDRHAEAYRAAQSTKASLDNLSHAASLQGFTEDHPFRKRIHQSAYQLMRTVQRALMQFPDDPKATRYVDAGLSQGLMGKHHDNQPIDVQYVYERHSGTSGGTMRKVTPDVATCLFNLRRYFWRLSPKITNDHPLIRLTFQIRQQLEQAVLRYASTVEKH